MTTEPPDELPPTTEYHDSDSTSTFSAPETSGAGGWKARIRGKLSGLRKSGSAHTDQLMDEGMGQERTAGGFPSMERTLTGIQSRFSQLDAMTMSRWVNHTLQGQGSAFYGKLATVILSAYFLSNLTGLLIENYIPEPPLPRAIRNTGMTSARPQTADDYQVIFSRNLFNSRGLIPGEQAATDEVQDAGGNPTKSNLPLNLIGTVILKNELRSIATIEDKSASIVYPVRMDDEIPGKIKVLSVEPLRVIFINVSTGRREYIELPEDLQVSNARITLGAPKKGTGATIEQIAPNQYNLPRAEVDKAMADINTVLTQARAVPNMENGVAAGYKLFQIVPGSIYDKLGLKNGDTLCGLNGENINDPARAFALLNELKTSSHLELCVKREGRQTNNSYDIR